ncbi:MAG: helix-turn-helix transcriptional regulator [Myxococcales bacterium]|nr:helix-turn-helix transcriptional regulator [Myxococcales bacterium]MCB9647200.1 helix-turn-helix transcriptional regulator [Deltaproteobacteria bacterium]
MERKRFEGAPCPIARSVDIVGDWWTPLIIRECLYGVNRFDDLQRWLGIGRNILTRRLEQLVEQGVLERRAYQERPQRYEYQLTDKGYDAARILLAMMPFGDKWQFERGREPIRVFDRRTGKRVRPVVVDAETGEPIDPRNLYAGPGPAFPADRGVRRERFSEYYQRKT